MSEIQLPQHKIDKLLEICDAHGNQPGELINVLHKAQHLFGYLPAEVQRIVADKLNIPVSKVYGVVTFYSFFTMTPKGEHPISVCMGTACYVRGAEKVLDEFKRILNINVGETTPDGKYSLSSLRCVGACGLAPVVLIGEKVFGRVVPGDVEKILKEYKNKNIIIATHGMALSSILNYYDPSYNYYSFLAMVKMKPWIVAMTFDDFVNINIEYINSFVK